MFVIELTYKAPLEEIDRYLPEHNAFLDQQYAKGIFLASGRKVPREGGIILATGKKLDVEAAVSKTRFTGMNWPTTASPNSWSRGKRNS